MATLPCEIVVFKKCNDPELCEENCHARLSHSKHLLKNIFPVTASFPFADEKIFIVYSDCTEKKTEMTDRMHLQQRRRKTTR